jgi:uncharacterized protein YukE
MAEGIEKLTEFGRKLESKEIWEGEGATSATAVYLKKLDILRGEQQRLKDTSNALKQYADRLIDNEQQIAQRARMISSLGTGVSV